MSQRIKLLCLCLLFSSTVIVRAANGDPNDTRSYRVTSAAPSVGRHALTVAGAVIDGSGQGYVDITADTATVARLRALGYQIAPLARPRLAVDAGYHSYAQMVAEVQAIAAAHPEIIASPFSIGNSYEGKPLLAVKISANPNRDEAKPEVLLIGHYHAREHLTLEMMLDILHMLADGYGTPEHAAIDALVQAREIWLVFDMNPDGGEYDISGGTYHYWRKNRQPNACPSGDDGNGNGRGTDMNRNHGYRWAQDDFGSSSDVCSETYRGTAPASAPEVAAIEQFVASRVISGTQQLTTAITFHSYGALVLWPYGYSFDRLPADMQPDDAATFAALGQAMARTNDYTPQQASDLYATNGDFSDWAYGAQRIFSYTFEMSGDFDGVAYGFYPPASVIARETARNRAAVLLILQAAACPYVFAGKAALHCTGDRFARVNQVWMPLIDR